MKLSSLLLLVVALCVEHVVSVPNIIFILADDLGYGNCLDREKKWGVGSETIIEFKQVMLVHTGTTTLMGEYIHHLWIVWRQKVHQL
jgi:hypothetical protein